MLRSLSDWALRPRIGIALGASTIAAAEVRHGGDAWGVRWARHGSLPLSLFVGEPDARCEEALAAALAQLAPEAARSAGPVHVALPDAAAHTAVFELAELPDGVGARLDLVRGLFERDRHLNAESLACCGQALGTDDGRELLYASAVRQCWIDCVQRALDRAGIVPWVLDTSATYAFNRASAAWTSAEGTASGALVMVDPQFWTLLVWDHAGRPRLVKSRWWAGTPDGPARGADAVAGEVQRLIQAYVRGEERRALRQLHVRGESAPARDVAAALGVRGGCAVARVDTLAGLAFAEPPDPATHGALTAAVGR